MVVISPRAIGGEDTRLEFLSPERGYPKGTGYSPYRSSVALAKRGDLGRQFGWLQHGRVTPHT